MKKIIAVLIVLVMILSLAGCDSSKYKEAMQMYERGEYAEAKEIFLELGDYEDSASMVKQCELAIIDGYLQGTWDNTQLSSLGITSHFTFTYGRVKAGLTIKGSTSDVNEGDYRIDLENQKVYVCYDYIIDTDGKTPNTEEKCLFSYTFQNGRFVLMDADGENTMQKQ